MDGQLIDACSEIATRLRTLAVDVEADLTPAERGELVEIALAMERLVGGMPPPRSPDSPGSSS